jgi:hypothetical protein
LSCKSTIVSYQSCRPSTQPDVAATALCSTAGEHGFPGPAAERVRPVEKARAIATVHDRLLCRQPLGPNEKLRAFGGITRTLMEIR